MMYKTIYHGSYIEVKNPDLKKCKATNDYGRGFYCAEDKELVKEWASKNETGVVNKYGLKTSGLSILNLKDNNVLEWITLLIRNRIVSTSSPIAESGYKYLIEHYSIDVSSYDVIIGYRADDSYFSFVRGFLNNTISVNDLAKAMKLGKLGEQIVIMSEKGIKNLKFISSEEIDSKVYSEKRITRDIKARKDFVELTSKTPINEDIYLIDIMRGKAKQ